MNAAQRLAALALAVALAACTGAAPEIASAPPPDPKTVLPALEMQIFTLVEAERLKTDPAAHPLTQDAELAAVARAHSEEMARDHFLGHRAPDGETTATLIMDADKNFQGLLGENIAAQYFTKAGGVDPHVYAKRFVESWMQSKSHRDNLAFPDYTRSGVGAAIDGDTVYVTQLFAADIAPPKAARSEGPRAVSSYSDPKSARSDQPVERASLALRGSEAHL